MNREEFYQEIGNIDDDLIQAADVQKPKKRMINRFVVSAACICLICFGIILGMRIDTVHINDIQVPAASKIVVPDDENTQIVPMTYKQLLHYYGIEQLPDNLGADLKRSEQSYFVIYQDQNGSILCDTNIVYYASADRTKALSITIAKAEDNPIVYDEDTRESKIDGVSIVLGASSGANNTAYLADFKLNDVSVRMISDGLSDGEFIGAVKEIIRILK